MEFLLAMAIGSGVFCILQQSIPLKKKEKEKTIEEQLGDAIVKYLKEGVKVQIVEAKKEEKKD